MKTLYALDIVNPFSKKVKMEGLLELKERLDQTACFDKVGPLYYKISLAIKDNKSPSADLVVEFLNYLNSLSSTRETVGFKLDESGMS